jgi:DNA (cytosine-5)-methyltransferase 1
VPQHRRRLFIVATKARGFEFPDPSHGPKASRAWLGAASAVSRGAIATDMANASPVVYAKRPHLRPSPFSGLLFNGSGRPIRLDLPAPTVLASAGGNKAHFIDTLDKVPGYHAHLRCGGRPHKGTLEGALRLSPGQCAKLQTLPAAPFRGPLSTRYRLIGNAVPPRLATAVGVALATHLQAHS